MKDPAVVTTPARELAAFAAALRFGSIPTAVVDRTEDLFLDWFASALAGKGARPVETIAAFYESQGPASGPAEILIHRATSSPLVAAAVNAASSHFAEQDDVHNGSVFHPAAVVIPPALAVAQAIGASGQDFVTAIVAGYEVGIRVGEFLGRSHYRIFHTTGTAGTAAAAAAVGRLLELSSDQMQHALGNRLRTGRDRDPFALFGPVGVTRGIVDRPIARPSLDNAELIKHCRLRAEHRQDRLDNGEVDDLTAVVTRVPVIQCHHRGDGAGNAHWSGLPYSGHRRLYHRCRRNAPQENHQRCDCIPA